MTKVLIGAPTTRDLPVPYVRSLWTTSIKGSLAWDIVYGQSVDSGRNMLVDRFLNNKSYKDFDYLLMHDTDATWEAGAVQRLIDRDLPVVTGIIFKRSIPTLPTAGKFVSISPEGNHMYSFKETINKIKDVLDREKFVIDNIKNELTLDRHDGDVVEIDGAGAHFMLIKREVLEKIGSNWYQCTKNGSGEDYDFCRKVLKAGYRIYADFSVFTGHHIGGMITVGLREFAYFTDNERIVTEWIA